MYQYLKILIAEKYNWDYHLYLCKLKRYLRQLDSSGSSECAFFFFFFVVVLRSETCTAVFLCCTSFCFTSLVTSHNSISMAKFWPILVVGQWCQIHLFCN